MSNFVILSLKRSGSTFLVSSLNTHEEIICTGEIFKETRPSNIIMPEYSYDLTKKESLGSRLKHFTSKPKLVKFHLDKIYSSTEKSLGFKLMPRQIKRYPSSIEYIIQQNIPAVLLIRKNYLERLISIQKAAKTKVFISSISTNKDQATTIELNPKTIIQTFDQMDQETELMKSYAAKTKSIAINYEDLTMNTPEKTQLEILDFIGVSKIPLTSNLKKLIKKPMSEVVTNFDEIQKIIMDSKYKNLLPG